MMKHINQQFMRHYEEFVCRMGIATYHINGVDYIVTANEGDSREWGEYLNEDERNFGKGETSPTGKITQPKTVD